MLRASSLGSIFTLKTHHLPCICYPTVRCSLDLTRGVSSLRDLKSDHNDRDQPPHVSYPHKSRIFVNKRVADDDVFAGQASVSSHSNQVDHHEDQNINFDSEDLSVREKLPYPTGRSRHLLFITPLFGGKYWHGDCFLECDGFQELKFPPKSIFHGQEGSGNVNTSFIPVQRDEELYFQLCDVIANTQSASEAWTAYSSLLTLPVPRTQRRGLPNIPFAHLHRLCRLLSRNRPKNRTQFLRLLSVLYFIRKYGGKIHLFEWNSLISNAGTGWRKTRPEDFKLALDVFGDMVSGAPPGTTFSTTEHPPLDLPNQPVQPDIFTYNTLVHIASKTLYGRAVQRASLLLQGSGQSPDRITHLSLLAFFTGSKQLSGVRSTLLKMRHQGLELGLDGVNACIWAYGYSGRVDVVKSIYRVLRHNLRPDQPEVEVESLVKALSDEGIFITAPLKPNEVTFTALIQIMAYYGDLTAALRIFMDMLSSDDLELGAPMFRDENREVKHTNYSPTGAVFRAIFLGFSKHGTTKEIDHPEDVKSWTLFNLQQVYRTFMSLPDILVPNKSVLYWIMVAFGKTSGYNVELMRQIWLEMEERFEGPWGSSTYRLQGLKRILFSDNAAEHLQKYGFSIQCRTDRASNDSTPWLS